MAIADRNGDSTYTRQRSRTLNSTNSSNNYSNNSDSDTEQSVRVGNDYQAEIPDFISSQPAPSDYPEKSIQVWTTSNDLDEEKIEDYLNIASEKYHYNLEQALGVLHWHNYNLKYALSDLANFVPYPDEWTVEDKVIFEQGFQFHSKNFQKINELLPDKKISNLVYFYYTWKNNKSKTSTVEKQVKRANSQLRDVNTNDSINESLDYDNEYESNQSAGVADDQRQDSSECSRCLNRSSIIYNSKHGLLCRNCYHHSSKKNLNKPDNSLLNKNIPQSTFPKPLTFSENVLKEIIKEHNIGAETNVLRKLDNEIDDLNKNIQNVRQKNSNEKSKLTGLKDMPLLNQCSIRFISRWTNEEVMMLTYGIAEHGKNFKRISDILGTKSESQVRNYYLQNNEKMNLSSLIKENDDS